MQIVFRTALHVENYAGGARSPVTSGAERKQDYLEGASALFSLLNFESASELLLVDNTVPNNLVLRDFFSDVAPRNTRYIASNTNRFGRKNKGAGDVETMAMLLRSGIVKEDFLFLELRLRICKPDFILDFLNKPRSLLAGWQQGSSASGYIGFSYRDAWSFYTRSFLASRMTILSLSIEDQLRRFWIANNLELWDGPEQFLRNDPITGLHLY